MAVSFKVPSSPAKSIFTIDEFLGVDLTNSPANIQDNRSPNAPNMTRLVPGKVRKRMGYYKDVVFGTYTNVNWAQNTSYSETLFDLEADTWTKLYDLVTPQLSGEVTYYVEFDYKSDYGLYLSYDSATPDVEASPDEYTHASLTFTITLSTPSRFTRQNVKSDLAQTIYIKNFSWMLAKDSSYKWSLAPKHIISTTADSEVFGFHKAISNGSQVTSIINVNRALGTGDPVTITASEVDVVQSFNLYYLAENVNDGRKIRLKFDYDYTITESGSYVPSFFLGYDNIFNFSTGSAVGSYSGTYVSDPIEITHHAGFTEQRVKLQTYSKMTATFSNFSILYDMTDDYTWSAAPEDSDYTYIEDLYTYGTKNYSVTSSKSSGYPSEGDPVTATITIQNSGVLKGYSKLSFDLYVHYNNLSTTGTTISVVYYDAYSQQDKTLDIVTLDPVIYSNGSVKFLLDPANTAQTPKGSNWNNNNYIKQVLITGNCTDENEMYISATNIRLQAATQKSDLSEADITKLYHVGNKMFSWRKSTGSYTASIYDNMNLNRSMSWQFGSKLFLIDGKNCYIYNYANNTIDRIGQTNAYIPLVTISKSPTGGGTSYDALNLLQPGFYEQFICTDEHEGDATAKSFQLSFNHLDKTTCQAWILDSTGEWQPKLEGTDFSVNRATGIVTFVNAPGVTPIAGEDNVKILAYKTFEGYSEKVRRCTFGALFGVNGASDRVFLSGNPDFPNYDWYSEMNDPTYFPDTGYSTLGLEISAIVGYSLVNNYLAAHKDANEPSQSVFIREGDLVKRTITTSTGGSVEVTDPAFKLINTLQGSPAITPYTFGYVETEPLFLTEKGVFALTTQDITGDKYGQNRSFYLNGSLMEEKNLKNAYGCIHDNMYYLAINNKIYLLDGLQATRTDRSDPYSTRQYVGYIWNNIPATILFEDEGDLFFGTADGRICRFYNDVDDLESYNDDGYPIDAWWETPDLDGKLFYKNKTFRYYAARLMSAIATSVKMWAMKSGAWTLIKTDNSTGRYFDFGNVNFEKFSFSTDQTEKVVHSKIKVKKVDKARFKLENDALNEPFGLFNIALEYVENGNYKG